MNINFDNNIPIYIQLLNYIKTFIISGQIQPGEKLPSVREFANMFKVNPNTIQKSLNELEEQKLIYTEITNGKYVTQDNEIIEKLRQGYAQKVIEEYFEKMSKIGIDRNEAFDYLKRKDGSLEGCLNVKQTIKI